MVLSLFVGRASSIAALEAAMGKDKRVLLTAQTDGKIDNPTEPDLHRVGTVGLIVQLVRLHDNTV
jgi:ATP-dependent Lon protease